jgi:hypothetical protein
VAEIRNGAKADAPENRGTFSTANAGLMRCSEKSLHAAQQFLRSPGQHSADLLPLPSDPWYNHTVVRWRIQAMTAASARFPTGMRLVRETVPIPTYSGARLEGSPSL